MNPIDPQRAKLRKHLLAAGLSESKLAARFGMGKNDFCPAMKASNAGFHAYRIRLRVERELGVLIWSSEKESAELVQIGKLLKLDMLTARRGDILSAALKLRIPVSRKNGVPGYLLFSELIRHLFPQSPSLRSPYYV